jgi:SSS family solute:Na+ symporter
MVGAALLVYYLRNPGELPEGISSPAAAGFSDRIFPHFISYGLPVGISGFVIAAIFAVAQSSIDSGINSTTSVIMIDLVRKYRRTPASEAGDLRLAQILTLLIGLVVTIMGILLSLAPKDYNLIDLQLKSFNCVLGPLGAMFMAGMLLRHVGQTPVVIAGITGAVCGLLFGFMDVLFTPLVQSLTGSETLVVRCPSPFLVIPLSWLVTFLLSALLSGFFPGPTLDQVRRFTWVGIFYGNKDNV